LNILFLSELFYPNGGGAELATYLYAKLLSEAKFNVVVIANRFAGEPEFSRNEGFTVYRLPLFRRGDSVKYSVLQRVDVLFSSFMRKWMKWADIVYVPRFWFSAIPLAKALGKPVITHLHDYIPICPLATFYDLNKCRVCESAFCSLGCIYGNERRKLSSLKAVESTLLNLTVWRFLRKCISQSDAVICVSKVQKDILARSAPWLASKLRVIYNPLPDLTHLPMDGADFGYFGGSNYMKGYSVLLNALSILHRKNASKPVRVHATKFFTQHRKEAEKLSITQFVPYDKLNKTAYQQIYKKICAVIVPSIWHEPLPYVVVEAMLNGRIVIGSKMGGIPEQLENCKGAFLFEAGNHFELANMVNFVNELSHESKVDLGAQNRQMVCSRFNKEKTLKAFIQICSNTGSS
jgi:glycosyltransferase involved in cell wall biosynthesis